VSIAEAADAARVANGLLTLAEVARLSEQGNCIFDPYSVLISRHARIGSGNTFYPGVTLRAGGPDLLVVGDHNVFHSSVSLDAELGPVTVGNRNALGEGGFTAKANRPGASLWIGDRGRYQGGAVVFGQCRLESGSQLLGMVTLDSCTLVGGGSFEEADPDLRAGLVKGVGRARGLVVEQGSVVVLSGDFQPSDVHRQSEFHRRS
jgi:hypothetical protein